MVEMLGKTVMDNLTTSLTNAFLDDFKGQYEEWQNQKSFKKANIGNNKKYIEEELKVIVENISANFNNFELYTEDELKQVFDKYFEEKISEIVGEDIKEELWKRFLVFASDVMKKYNKCISLGEKRILEETRNMKETLEESISNINLCKKMISKSAQSQCELQKKLFQNKDIPFVSVDKLYEVEIRDFEPQYVFYGNTFDFDETEDRNDPNNEGNDIYVFRMLIKNIGSSIIERISMGNFQMAYLDERDDADPETGFRMLPIMKHCNRIERLISIFPNGEEFIQFIVKKREYELVDENIISYFWEEYQPERLYVTFDMTLKGKEEKEYSTLFFLTKKYKKNTESINGLYRIDYSVVMEKQ